MDKITGVSTYGKFVCIYENQVCFVEDLCEFIIKDYQDIYQTMRDHNMDTTLYDIRSDGLHVRCSCYYMTNCRIVTLIDKTIHKTKGERNV